MIIMKLKVLSYFVMPHNIFVVGNFLPQYLHKSIRGQSLANYIATLHESLIFYSSTIAMWYIDTLMHNC